MATDLNAQWVKVRTLTHADADVDIANTVASISCAPLTAPSNNTHVVILDSLIRERIQMAGNAGTLVLDIGVSGTTEEIAKDVSLKATSGTNTLGSATTSVKPRLIRPKGYIPLLTLTSSSGNLSTLTAGEVDIFLLVGAAPALN